MKRTARWTMTLATTAGVCWGAIVGSQPALGATAKLAPALSSYEQEKRDAAAARGKDPAWKASAGEVAVIQVGDGKRPGALRNFCLDGAGNVLACLATPENAKAGAPKVASAVRVYSPQGELLKTLPLTIRPTAICVAADGSIFVAGDGQVLKLDADGKVLASATSPVADAAIVVTKEFEDMVREMIKTTKRSFKDEMSRLKTSLETRRSTVTGLAATSEDVFLAVPSPKDFTYCVYRFDQSLKNPALVVEKLRGCCGQMDIQAHDGKLWIPHNARHTVECRDRDGKEVAKFGKAGRVKAQDFGGCCEPKNMRVLPNGDILAAESGPPTCIKRFSPEGKFLGVVVMANETEGDCVRVTVDVSPDGKRFYMLDTTRDAIRVFGAKS